MYLARSFITSKIRNSERGYFIWEVFYFTRCSVLFHLLKGGFIVWRVLYLGGLLPTTGRFLQTSPYITSSSPASLPAGRGGCWCYHCGGGRSLVAAYLLLGEAALPWEIGSRHFPVFFKSSLWEVRISLFRDQLCGVIFSCVNMQKFKAVA